MKRLLWLARRLYQALVARAVTSVVVIPVKTGSALCAAVFRNRITGALGDSRHDAATAEWAHVWGSSLSPSKRCPFCMRQAHTFAVHYAALRDPSILSVPEVLRGTEIRLKFRDDDLCSSNFGALQ